MIDDLTTRAGDADRVDFEWGHILWLDGAALTGGEGLTVGRVTIESGKANAEHSHPNCNEALYLLSGRLRHSLGDAATVLEPGDLLHIPRGERHAAESVGTGDAVAVIAYDAADREVAVVAV
jgi:quercetin dioxygenase-like cupin family protein